MSAKRWLVFSLWALALAAPPAGAHEVRPGYLELRELDAAHWDVSFKIPARGGSRLALAVSLPEGCETTEPVERPVPGAQLVRTRASCEEGLVGGRVEIDGLELTRTDVLVRVERLDTRGQIVRLTPASPSFQVAGEARRSDVAGTYFVLGVEHILQGIDHLLFVLALLFLVAKGRRLVGTITAFSLAHSLTLAAAALGHVHVPQAPVEAAIALSIVFVATEIVHAARGRKGLSARKPWLVALAFGLLHGLGFAGALREVGLPEHAIPMALLFFNLGVEAGQLLFLGAVVLLLVGFRRVLPRSRATDVWTAVGRVAQPAAYAIGFPAAYWWIERTAAFFE